MITYFYKNIRSKRLNTLQEYQSGTWVCVEEPTTEELQYLIRRFSLDEGNVRDVLDDDEMPRLEKEGELTYIYVRYAYKGDDTQLVTAPLLTIIGKDLFITIAFYKLPRLQRFINGKIEFSTTQRTKLFLQIMTQVFDQYDVYINDISKQIKAIRSRLKSHEISNQHFINFVLIEDELNEFISALVPTTAILRRLMLGRHIPLFSEDEDLVEDLLLSNEQSIEGCRSAAKSIVSIREAYSTIASNNLNRTMKILTAATMLIALPNVFFGMYGMNVDLPFAEEWWAYSMVILVTITTMGAIIMFGRIRKIF